MGLMGAGLEAYGPPRLESRAPTAGLIDERDTERLIQDCLQPTRPLMQPTVLVVNLEGRFPTPTAIYRLVVEVGQQLKAGAWGQMAVILASPDPGLRAVAQALAERYDLPLFWTSSADEIWAAEPLAKLTPADRQTLEALRSHGGRATVGLLAGAIGTDHTAAGNRVNNLDKRHLVFRIDRPRPSGHLYMDPRVAEPAEPSPRRVDGEALSAELQAELAAVAAMQGVASQEEVASAWRSVLAKHHNELVQAHERTRQLVERGDRAGIAAIARKQLKARRPQRPTKN